MEHKKIPALFVLLFLGIGSVYVLTSSLITDIFTPSYTNYYPYILDSFLHGRVNIPHPPSSYDVSFFEGKWYLNWGPSPVLFVLPFYLIWGLGTSDVLFTLIAGIANVVLFFFVAREFAKYFKIKLSPVQLVFLILTFAFASANFYMSLAGRVWHAEQIIAVFYLLISYLFLFRYLNKKNLWLLLLASFFFNLAWTSRYALIFSSLILLYPLVLHFRANRFLPVLAAVFIPCIIFGSLILTYNYLKFQNPFDTGLKHHLGAGRFEEVLKNHTFFSPSYVPYNAYYYFLHAPKLTSQPPYIKLDEEGNSMFLMYPALFLLLPLLRRKNILNQKIKYYLITVGLVTVCSMLLYLFYFTTGWTQVGLRYFFDIFPLLLLTIILSIRHIPIYLLSVVLLLGVLMHVVGIVMFY